MKRGNPKAKPHHGGRGGEKQKSLPQINADPRPAPRLAEAGRSYRFTAKGARDAKEQGKNLSRRFTLIPADQYFFLSAITGVHLLAQFLFPCLRGLSVGRGFHPVVRFGVE